MAPSSVRQYMEMTTARRTRIGMANLLTLLNSLLHSQENDDGRGSKEEQEPAKRFKGAPYKAGKIVVGCGCGTASREKDGKVFDDPPSDDGVVGKDDDGDGGRQDAKESKA